MSAGRKGRRNAVVNGDLRMNKEQHKVTVQSLREGRPGSRRKAGMVLRRGAANTRVLQQHRAVHSSSAQNLRNYYT